MKLPTFSPAITVLSVDQSLVNSGWVLLRVGQEISVLDFGTIHTRPQSGLSGFADSFERGDHLFGAFRALLMITEPDIILHEMPAIMNRVSTRNREAGTVSAMALRCAISSLGLRGRVRMIQAQHAKKVVTGDVKADKKKVKESVSALGWFGDSTFNEHVSDATALALTAMIDGVLDEVLKTVDKGLPPVGEVK